MGVRTLSLLFLTLAAAMPQTTDPPREVSEAALRARLANSVSVVIGKVVDSPKRIPWKGPGGEHVPDWWEAPVRVSSTLAGTSRKGVIRVAFAYAYENLWESAPKLRPGEEAIFLLHRFDPKDAFERVHGAFEVTPVEGLLVIDPNDVQPLSERAHVIAIEKSMRKAK